ncbi:MAG: hypothetical protein K6G16_06950 [Lachnospiraceae bacterium]|nr:hypothetical protein [Lachnospiraceae bacterium]
MYRKNRKKTRWLSLALATFLIGATPFTTLGSVTAYAVESAAVAEITEILPGRLSVRSAYYREIGSYDTVASNVKGNAGDSLVLVHAGDLPADASATTSGVQVKAVQAAGQEENTPVYDSQELSGLIAERNAREQTWIKTLLANSYNERDELRRAAFRGELSALAATAAFDTSALDNVLPAGALLTADAFDGCTVTYNGQDSLSVAEGINEIDVVITVNDPDRAKSTVNVDLFSPQNSYRADRSLLSSTGGLGVNPRKGLVWKTKLFVVGAPDYADEVQEAERTGRPLVHRPRIAPKLARQFDAKGRPVTQDQIYARFLQAIREAEEADRAQNGQEQSSAGGNPSGSADNGGGSGSGGNSSSGGERQADVSRRTASETSSRTTESVSRTILLYLNGSNLESNSHFGTRNLRQILTASANSANSGVRFFVMTGGTASWHLTDTDLLAGATEISADHSQVWEIVNGRMYLIENEAAFLSAPMMEASTLTSFIDYATAIAPADLCDIILWDHGSGPDGFGSDNSANAGTKRDMSLADISRGLQNSAWYQSGKYFDFIGFDACLMGNTEVTTALSPYADYLIGSEELEPGVGWNYTWLSDLIADPGMGTENLGKKIVDTFIAQFGATGNATLSLMDLTRVWELEEALNSLGDLLYADVVQAASGDYIDILSSRERAMAFSTTGGYYSSDLVDLGTLMYLLRNNYANGNRETSQAYQTQIDRIMNLLGVNVQTDAQDRETVSWRGNPGGLVLYEKHTADVKDEFGYNTLQPTGLSIYFPYYGVYRLREGKNPGGDPKEYERYRIVDLLKVYQDTNMYRGAYPEAYVKAAAALALRQISGMMIGTEWKSATSDEELKNIVLGYLRGEGDYSYSQWYRDRQVQRVTEAAGLLSEQGATQLEAIITQQISERIKVSGITIEPALDDQNQAIDHSYVVSLGDNVSPATINRMDVKISYTASGREVELGRTPLYYDKAAFETQQANENYTGSPSITTKPFDNEWYTVGYSLGANDYTADGVTMDWQVASFYFTEVDDQGSDRHYTGVIPVCVWSDNNDVTRYNSLKNAYSDDKISVYLVQVRFDWDSQTNDFSKGGQILGVQNLSENGATRGRNTLYSNTAYGLLGNAESIFGGNGLNEDVVSVGMVKTDNSGNLGIKLQPVTDLQSIFTLVDVYGTDYELTRDNLTATTAQQNADTMNVGTLEAGTTLRMVAEGTENGNAEKANAVLNYVTDDQTRNTQTFVNRSGSRSAAGTESPDADGDLSVSALPETVIEQAADAGQTTAADSEIAQETAQAADGAGNVDGAEAQQAEEQPEVQDAADGSAAAADGAQAGSQDDEDRQALADVQAADNGQDAAFTAPDSVDGSQTVIAQDSAPQQEQTVEESQDNGGGDAPAIVQADAMTEDSSDDGGSGAEETPAE